LPSTSQRLRARAQSLDKTPKNQNLDADNAFDLYTVLQ